MSEEIDSSKRKIVSDNKNQKSKKSKANPLMIKELPSTDDNDNKPRQRNFHSLDQYTKHKLLINYYCLTHRGTVEQLFQRDKSNDKNDLQVLIENHRFQWSDEELQSDQLTWGQRVAKKYYERLFKEYCIIDLTHYKQNKFGMRWRTESEVINGKGQFICANKYCSSKNTLKSWEVLFTYIENNEKKSALIKVRLCPDCSHKLNYHHQHKKAKKMKRKELVNKIDFDIKEEIVTSDDEMVKKKNLPTTSSNANNEDETYEHLIDRIWRKPIKLEDDDNDECSNHEQNLENELDDYLDEFFQ